MSVITHIIAIKFLILDISVRNMFKAKHLYLVIMSGLTSTAMYACYWQTKKYFIACERWKIIAR